MKSSERCADMPRIYNYEKHAELLPIQSNTREMKMGELQSMHQQDRLGSTGLHYDAFSVLFFRLYLSDSTSPYTHFLKRRIFRRGRWRWSNSTLLPALPRGQSRCLILPLRCSGVRSDASRHRSWHRSWSGVNEAYTLVTRKLPFLLRQRATRLGTMVARGTGRRPNSLR